MGQVLGGLVLQIIHSPDQNLDGCNMRMVSINGTVVSVLIATFV